MLEVLAEIGYDGGGFKYRVSVFVNTWWHKLKQTKPEAVVTSSAEHGLKWDMVDKEVRVVLKTLHEAGFAAYVVGGCVRDLLLGQHPKDYDVVTNAKPDEIHKLFKRSLQIGRRFPLVHVRFSRHYFVEVVTFRGPKRWWRSQAWGCIESDALRRDFTVNALYLKYPECDLVDYTDGYTDLRQGCLRMIGNPALRYEEDPVRALRALRFAAKLHLVMEHATKAALKEALPQLATVSPDRLYGEVLKAFYGGAGWRTYQVLIRHNVLGILLPGVINGRAFPRQHAFIRTALGNADTRFLAGESLSGAFLFAVLFWGPFQKKLRSYSRKASLETRVRRAAKSVLLRHQIRIAFPKRIYESVESIWLLQYQWDNYEKAEQLMRHPRFRAAFDFLVLRHQAGEAVNEWLEWWENFCKEQAFGEKK